MVEAARVAFRRKHNSRPNLIRLGHDRCSSGHNGWAVWKPALDPHWAALRPLFKPIEKHMDRHRCLGTDSNDGYHSLFAITTTGIQHSPAFNDRMGDHIYNSTNCTHNNGNREKNSRSNKDHMSSLDGMVQSLQFCLQKRCFTLVK